MRIRILLSNLIRIRIRQFCTDPDPYNFKEVMYLKQYFTFLLDFPCQYVQQDPHKKYSLLNSPFQLILLSSFRVTFGSGSSTLGERIRIMKDYTDPHGSGSGSGSATLGSMYNHGFHLKHSISEHNPCPTYLIIQMLPRCSKT
jgi:hypothetical protein